MDQKSVLSHSAVIGLWPSLDVFAGDLGMQYLAVHKWQTRDSIPPRYWVRLVAAAHERDLPVTFKSLAEWCATRDAAILNS